MHKNLQVFLTVYSRFEVLYIFFEDVWDVHSKRNFLFDQNFSTLLGRIIILPKLLINSFKNWRIILGEMFFFLFFCEMKLLIFLKYIMTEKIATWVNFEKIVVLKRFFDSEYSGGKNIEY